MAGALMQLVAYGAQDVYLTSEPTITFWKAVYRRHTNFAMESIKQTFSGTPDFGKTVSCRISRNGDLMSRVWVEATLPNLSAGGPNLAVSYESYVARVGFCLLNTVELRIGGQMIDRHFSRWMHIWTELTASYAQKNNIAKLLGGTNFDDSQQRSIFNVNNGFGGMDGVKSAFHTGGSTNSGDSQVVRIPLLFSFCRHPGLAIPLIALQYHEVEIFVTFETLQNCCQFWEVVDARQVVTAKAVVDANNVFTQATTGTQATVIALGAPFNGRSENERVLKQLNNITRTSANYSWAQGRTIGNAPNGILGLTNADTDVIIEGLTEATTNEIDAILPADLPAAAAITDNSIRANAVQVLQVSRDGNLDALIIALQPGATTLANLNNTHPFALITSIAANAAITNQTTATLPTFNQIATEMNTVLTQPILVRVKNALLTITQNRDLTTDITGCLEFIVKKFSTVIHETLKNNNNTIDAADAGTDFAVNGSRGTIAIMKLVFGAVTVLVSRIVQNVYTYPDIHPTGSLKNVEMWVDYIFLDTDERKEFAQKPHEYLIETVQTQESTLAPVTSAQNVRLTFNHPTKFIAWVARDPGSTISWPRENQRRGPTVNTGQLGDKFTNFTSDAQDNYNYDMNIDITDMITTGDEGRVQSGRTGNIATSLLQLNGQDRFATRSGNYFDTIQPFQHFSGRPDVGINVYSFAVKPEEHQPSGTCNFSRIDNASLILTLNVNINGSAVQGNAGAVTPGTTVTATQLSVFALSYNVFRVASGMGGLAYSN